MHDLPPTISASRIHEFLEISAAKVPARIAVVEQPTRTTYCDLNRRANRMANWLIQQGVSQGERIAFVMENSAAYIAVYYGILKAGGVAVPLSTDIKPESLKTLLAQLEPAAVIASRRYERLLKAAEIDAPAIVIASPKLHWPNHGRPVTALEDILAETTGMDQNPDLPVPPEALASIIYTSGSTGIPKGVMLSHGNIIHNTRSICAYLSLTSDDIQMVVLPFFYVMGKSLLNTHMAVGGRVVINNKFAYPASVLEEMESQNVTGFSGVPSTYAYLLHRSPLGKFRDRLSHLRYCSQAGGHMAPHIKQQLMATLPPHTRLFIMYGATEAGARLSYVPPDRLPEKNESIGIAIPDVTLRIVDKSGRELPPGQRGELVAQGPNIMMGYWRDPKATAEVLDECGYHTGDMGYRDAQGYFFLEGRKDNIMKVGGHRINPQEVEDAMISTGLLLEVVVVGLPDELLGNRLAALAVLNNDQCEPREVLKMAAAKLPKYKLPQTLHFVRTLPKKSNGKIDKNRCCDKLQQLMEEALMHRI